MSTSLHEAVSKYLRSGYPARGTRAEYRTTTKKWEQWGNGVHIAQLGRKEIREFLDWVYERTVAQEGTNPGRTTNKARDHLRAIISWAWEQDLIESPPRFPKPQQQRDVAGLHYLTKREINALYFATHQMKRPRGWDSSFPVRRYWRCALALSLTTASTQEQYGNQQALMSRFCGDISAGIDNRQTAISSNSHLGVGCSIVESRRARRSIGQ
jgi:hypothetical protein